MNKSDNGGESGHHEYLSMPVLGMGYVLRGCEH